MIKKKKVARFRELYNVINEWLESYTYDDTAELLRSKYDLDLTTGTLINYVHRHRKHLAKQSVIKDELVQHSENNGNTEKSDELNISSSKTKEVNKIDVDSESDNQDDEELDFNALLKEFKNKHRTDQTKSLLDK